MATLIPSARQSTESIERLYITMRHLFYRGAYKVNGTSGLALRKLLIKLNPEIYGTIADPNKVELNGLLYVLDRLPEGIEQCSFINLTSNEGYDVSSFEPIVPLKRRRNSYRIDEDQMNIEVLRGRSEIYDILTHLTFFYNEADKVMLRAFENSTKKMSRVWQKIEDVVFAKEPLTQKEKEVGLIHLAHILGRTFEETLMAYNAFSWDKNPNRLFHVIYWMGKLSHADYNARTSREVTFTTALRSEVGHHIVGEKWANQIKENLLAHDLIHKDLHIISSNLHSVMNMLFAHKGLGQELNIIQEYKIYEELSDSTSKDLRDKVKTFAESSGLISIVDKSGSNIDVQIIDLDQVDLSGTYFGDNGSKQNKVLLVMDYAFGEQAFELMDELLKPYKGETPFDMNVKSISIMGKAGILEGTKGDIMVPSSFVFEGTADNYPFVNQLDPSDFNVKDLGVFKGMMITVLGTSLQNKDILEFFKNTTWGCIGLEMEGAHYHKAIQIASQIRGHIQSDVKVSYAYYASDNPLETGSTLASGGLGLTGVKPTYLITKTMINKILS
ncbi:hypothetical protein GO491_02755 [Flavobacteriaceae bacterium Ap0902]|nr:hypothetical protein [Flavobacteriaceae bacterium Ap0902]